MSVDFLSRVNALNDLKFPTDQYVITGSGPLAIRNLRRASDIDVLVIQQLWDKLAEQHQDKIQDHGRILIGDFDVWKEFPITTYSVEKLVEDSEMIEGYPFMKLEYIRELKNHLNRPKDREDMELIQGYMSEKVRQ